jgi:hypothetical protein
MKTRGERGDDDGGVRGERVDAGTGEGGSCKRETGGGRIER